MAEFGEENKVQGVYGGVEFEGTTETTGTVEQAGAIGGIGEVEATPVFQRVEASALPAKTSIWSKVKSFLFQEIDLTAPIKVELTPYQQKVEDEINEFLHQEISFKGFFDLIRGKK